MAKRHNIYGPTPKNRDEITGIIETGWVLLGNPGASPKPFADSRKSTMTFGADIYMRNPFEHERIETFFVHQTDPITFTELGKSIPSDLDLVNDRGVHSPNANIETLKFRPTKVSTHKGRSRNPIAKGTLEPIAHSTEGGPDSRSCLNLVAREDLQCQTSRVAAIN
jgi:hypothetical protein